jgi:hypothetical protein
MLIERKYTLERDDENGYWMLLHDGVGMAKSKSRNVLKRIRDALEAVEGGGVYGLTVEAAYDHRRGVVLALQGAHLIVRTSTGQLEDWNATGCHVVEPARPDKATPWNDPAIGVLSAVALLKRCLAYGISTQHAEGQEIVDDVRAFLKAREDAQPVP